MNDKTLSRDTLKTLKAIRDFVLVKINPEVGVSDSKLLYLPSDAPTAQATGEVINAGPGWYQGGTFISMPDEIRAGAKVIFNEFGGDPILEQKEKEHIEGKGETTIYYKLMPLSNIHAVFSS